VTEHPHAVLLITTASEFCTMQATQSVCRLLIPFSFRHPWLHSRNWETTLRGTYNKQQWQCTQLEVPFQKFCCFMLFLSLLLNIVTLLVPRSEILFRYCHRLAHGTLSLEV